jgi:hypothetical protein
MATTTSSLSPPSTNLNTQVLTALIQLADTLARLNENHEASHAHPSTPPTDATHDLTALASAMTLSSTPTIAHYKTEP